MRLFVAIELSNDLRAKLGEMSAALKDSLRTAGHGVSWVKPENLHVTLKFVGEVPEGRLPELCDALRLVPPSGSILMSAAKLECLPSHHPRVIAAAMSGEMDRLGDLHRGIEAQCAAVEIPIEARKYLPHITLARVKGKLKSSVADLERCAQPYLPAPEMTAGEFALMESRLKSSGAQYIRLARFPMVTAQSETPDSPAAE